MGRMLWRAVRGACSVSKHVAAEPRYSRSGQAGTSSKVCYATSIRLQQLGPQTTLRHAVFFAATRPRENKPHSIDSSSTLGIAFSCTPNSTLNPSAISLSCAC